MQERKTGFSSYFLTFDGGARLELINRPELCDQAKAPYRTCFYHIAFSVGSRREVDRLTARLAPDGYKVVSGLRVKGDGYCESCVVCAQGNEIEIIA